ncbi:MAG: hypothetical protein U0359_23575 [Byssovorax sp.]
MRPAEILVFNDIIYTNTTAYTSASFNNVLAQHGMFAIMAVIDNVSAANVGFDLFVEHSCDGRNWLQRNDPSQTFPPPNGPTTGDIMFNASLNMNTTYARVYSDTAWNVTKIGASLGNSGGPILGYTRFAMKLSAGFAHVKVYAVLRDTTAPALKRRAPGIHL